MIQPRLPPLGYPSNFSRALYTEPPSHDFLVWLVTAELSRIQHNSPPPLTVKFGLFSNQLGRFDFSNNSLSSRTAHVINLPPQYSDQMLPAVLRPAISMLGAIESPPIHLDDPSDWSTISEYIEYDYHIRHLVTEYRTHPSIILPTFTPPPIAFVTVDAWLDSYLKSQFITITLRESSLQPERNSNLPAWHAFAKSISNDYPVIFIRDTASASDPFPPFKTCPLASINAFFRAALYQRAFINLFVSNGPVGWAIFSSTPYLIFKQLIPSLPTWAGGQPSGWLTETHLQVGQSWPWATPFQYLTWTDDTFDNISTAFSNLISAMP